MSSARGLYLYSAINKLSFSVPEVFFVYAGKNGFYVENTSLEIYFPILYHDIRSIYYLGTAAAENNTNERLVGAAIGGILFGAAGALLGAVKSANRFLIEITLRNNESVVLGFDTSKKCDIENFIEQSLPIHSVFHKEIKPAKKNIATAEEIAKITQSSTSINTDWICEKCGCISNPKDSLYCKSCNSPKYSLKNLEEEKINTIKKYIEKQCESENLEASIKLQEVYFNTTSLSYMVPLLPNAKEMDSLETYKEQLHEIINSLESNKTEETSEPVKNSNETVPSSESNIDENSLEEKLKKLKDLFEKKLIDEQEYKSMKASLLGI